MFGPNLAYNLGVRSSSGGAGEMDGAVIEGRLNPASYAARRSFSPLKGGVLVDLTLSHDAGGHVKCWERIAEAAVDCGDRLDLTVHFNGPQPRRIDLSRSVRYVLLPPV